MTDKERAVKATLLDGLSPPPEAVAVTTSAQGRGLQVLVVAAGFAGLSPRAREREASAAIAEIRPAIGKVTFVLRSPLEEAFVRARSTDTLLRALAALRGAAADRAALTQLVLAKRRACDEHAIVNGLESEWTDSVQRAAKATISSLREPASDASSASMRPNVDFVVDAELLALLPPPGPSSSGAPAEAEVSVDERVALLRELGEASARARAAQNDAQEWLRASKAAGARLYDDALLLAEQSLGFPAILEQIEREERALASETDVPTLEAEIALARERLSAAAAARADLEAQVAREAALGRARKQAAKRTAAQRPPSPRRLGPDAQRDMSARLSTAPVAAARAAQPRFLVWHGQAGKVPSRAAIAARLGGTPKGRELAVLFRIDSLTKLQAERREVLVPTSCHGELLPGSIRLELVPGDGGDDDDDGKGEEEEGEKAALHKERSSGRRSLGTHPGSTRAGGGFGTQAVCETHDERVIARPGLPVYLTLRGFSALRRDDCLLVLVERKATGAARRAAAGGGAKRLTDAEFAAQYAQRLKAHAESLRATQAKWAPEARSRKIPWKVLGPRLHALSQPASSSARALLSSRAEDGGYDDVYQEVEEADLAQAGAREEPAAPQPPARPHTASARTPTRASRHGVSGGEASGVHAEARQLPTHDQPHDASGSGARSSPGVLPVSA